MSAYLELILTTQPMESKVNYVLLVNFASRGLPESYPVLMEIISPTQVNTPVNSVRLALCVKTVCSWTV